MKTSPCHIEEDQGEQTALKCLFINQIIAVLSIYEHISLDQQIVHSYALQNVRVDR